jgi:DNA polymerase-3 subunit epsilon
LELNLKKTIAFFDLETTGIDIANDRIVEISILKIDISGKEEWLTSRINPGIPIPPAATAIHGISDADVADAPSFNMMASSFANFIGDSDIAGYNALRFDVPLLAEEFLRAGVDFDFKNRKYIDVQVIFHKKEQRTLVAAYQFYCDKQLNDAHSAKADTQATYEVLKAQLDTYGDLENDIDKLAEFSDSSGRSVDFLGRIVLNTKGEETINFGKYKGKTIAEITQIDKGYLEWILRSDFPLYTKKILSEIIGKSAL